MARGMHSLVRLGIEQDIFLPQTYMVPQLDVETEVDVEVLVMIVVEDAVGLPRLPPFLLEVNPGVVDDAVIVGIEQNGAKRD